MMRIALLLSLVCASATSSAGESPVKVTVQQLLAASQKFVGKRVDVTGWYSVHAEDSQLYASSRAMSRGTSGPKPTERIERVHTLLDLRCRVIERAHRCTERHKREKKCAR